jgi:hypothetical protein
MTVLTTERLTYWSLPFPAPFLSLCDQAPNPGHVKNQRQKKNWILIEKYPIPGFMCVDYIAFFNIYTIFFSH